MDELQKQSKGKKTNKQPNTPHQQVIDKKYGGSAHLALAHLILLNQSHFNQNVESYIIIIKLSCTEQNIRLGELGNKLEETDTDVQELQNGEQGG